MFARMLFYLIYEACIHFLKIQKQNIDKFLTTLFTLLW